MGLDRLSLADVLASQLGYHGRHPQQKQRRAVSAKMTAAYKVTKLHICMMDESL